MMEKLQSSSVSKKPSKKSTMAKAASEPKNIKIGSQKTKVKPKMAASLQTKSKMGKSKLTTNEITVSQENTITTKPTIPQLTKANKIKAKPDNVKPKNVNLLMPAVISKKHKINKQPNPALEQGKIPDETLTSPSKKKKKRKASVSEAKDLPVNGTNDNEELLTKIEESVPKAKVISEDSSSEDIGQKYGILKDKQLIEKFLKVPMSNNQKGRIRLALRLSLKGTPKEMFSDMINAKIEAMLKDSHDLTNSELRRIRILYNMLKTSIEAPDKLDEENIPPKKEKNKKKKNKESVSNNENGLNNEKEGEHKKVKGPKRYVVFLGNLPLDVNKEKIMDHFKELNEHIKDIRIPKLAEGKKSAIAYVELSNEPSYELALSKHHSMMGNKCIRVLYTTQQNSKISRSEAKGKSAKLIALQKAGKLIGSIPATKKRSHRRAIMKAAKAKESAEVA